MIKNIAKFVLAGLLITAPLSGMLTKKNEVVPKKLVAQIEKTPYSLTLYIKNRYKEGLPYLSKQELYNMMAEPPKKSSQPIIGLAIESRKESLPLTLKQEHINLLPKNLKYLAFKNCIFKTKKLNLSKFKSLKKIAFENCKIHFRNGFIGKKVKKLAECFCRCETEPWIKYPSSLELETISLDNVFPFESFIGNISSTEVEELEINMSREFNPKKFGSLEKNRNVEFILSKEGEIYYTTPKKSPSFIFSDGRYF